MALRTNSKKVKETIKNYIMDSFHDSDFEHWHNVNITDYSTICSVILSTFKSEYIHDYNKNNNRQNEFINWAQGLPSIINTCYYYNVSAVDLLGDWLEETESEKSKFSENQAEELITKLIYRELTTNGCYLPEVKKADYDSIPSDYRTKDSNGINRCFGSKVINQEPSTILYTEDVHFVLVR